VPTFVERNRRAAAFCWNEEFFGRVLSCCPGPVLHNVLTTVCFRVACLRLYDQVSDCELSNDGGTGPCIEITGNASLQLAGSTIVDSPRYVREHACSAAAPLAHMNVAHLLYCTGSPNSAAARA